MKSRVPSASGGRGTSVAGKEVHHPAAWRDVDNNQRVAPDAPDPTPPEVSVSIIVVSEHNFRELGLHSLGHLAD